ncbi:MAG: ferritin-like domain-containing protein [Longimicrobiaceae bacterium]
MSEACELEHGLACSYLYTAFTLKEDLREGGLNWRQLQMVRKWAAQIYFVAAEEMLHLAQAWNLLAAIGGTPYYLRPNFPQSCKYYPFGLPLALEPFGLSAVQRFIFYELPSEVSPAEQLAMMGIEPIGIDGRPYRTVGELYGHILSGFEAIPEKDLFLGNPARQVGRELVDFPDIVRVVDRDTARRAITVITEQGEGTDADRTDCHYGVFLTIREELKRELAEAPFAPARDTIQDPIAKRRGNYGTDRGSLIEDPYTREVALLFDEVYGLMLRMLQYVFSNSTGDPATLLSFSRRAIQIMPTIILPLGVALTRLPAGPSYPAKTAGPAFGLTRHVPLPVEPGAASTLVSERLAELLTIAQDLGSRSEAPPQIQRAVAALAALADI